MTTSPAGALNVPAVGVSDLVVASTDDDRYVEDENFRPDVYSQYGTVDTSDTGGGAHQSIAEVSPVFAHARAANLITAARALDPLDPGVGSELVTLPETQVNFLGPSRSADDARTEIETAITDLADNPVVLGGPTSQQRLAAEEYEGESDYYDERTGARRPSVIATGLSTGGGKRGKGSSGSGGAASKPPATSRPAASRSTPSK